MVRKLQIQTNSLANQRMKHLQPLKEIQVAFKKSLKIPKNIILANKAKNWCDDFYKLSIALKDRHEAEIYNQAIREYNIAQVALNSCMYRFAFSGLRFFCEQIVFALQFSGSEIDYREWANGHRDLYWTEVVSEDTGVFSVKFFRAFGPEFINERKTYLEMTKKAYRECSEFVHNNASKHKVTDAPLKFDQATFEKWHDLADTIRLSFLFLWSVRYLKSLDDSQKNEIESVLLDTFPSMTAIRNFYA